MTSGEASGWFTAIGDDRRLIVLRPVRWGVGHALVGLFIAQFAGLLGGIIVLSALGGVEEGVDPLDELSIGLLVVLQTFLWIGYGGWALYAARRWGSGPVLDYGWRFRSPADVYQGLVAGIGLQLLAVPALYAILFLVIGRRDVSEEAQKLVDLVASPLDAVLLVVVVAIGAPIIEEFFFRGLLLRSLHRRLGAWPAIVLSSLLFAAIHLQPLQFPALFMFGMFAAWLTERTGRLGPAVWAHIGFNGVTVALLLLMS